MLMLFIRFSNNIIELIISYLDNAILLYVMYLYGLVWCIYVVLCIWVDMSWFNRSLTTNIKLDLLWTVIPILFIWFGIYQSIEVLFSVALIRINSTHIIKVLAYQWYWVYDHIESRIVKSNDLIMGMPRLVICDQPVFIPIYKNINWIISSNDVMHCWSIPALGIKVDAIPGRLTSINMIPYNEGVYSGFCFELCGIGHSFMPILVIIY